MTTTIATTKQFPLGQVVATPGALRSLEAKGMTPAYFLARHHSGDWGDMDEEDKTTNDEALENGSRIFSSYELGDLDGSVWVITEADRSSTTVLLPSEY